MILKVKDKKSFPLNTSKYKYIFFAGLLAFAVACSTKKDTFVNRNFHSVNTKYNVLYNGNKALVTGLAELKTSFSDNYWDVLPVERMQRSTEEMEPTDKRNAGFERAETKATKAIQKHSMYIGGIERNPQMDEAHLLLGKSRYYDNRFVPALEAFNYVLYKYPNSSQIDEVKVWREKTNIRLDNDGVAIKNLRKLLEDKQGQMDDQIYSDANAMLAQAYIKTENKDSAVYVLKEAAKYSRDNEKKARYRFILGQLYGKMKQPDSSYAYYQQVIDMHRKSPRIYTIQAHAMQAGQFDFKAGDTLAFMEKYRDLLKDRENRPYLDIINHQVGLFYDKQGLDDKAIEYYNMSLRKKANDKYLAASNYRNIAEINFARAKYVAAGKYYDSTMVYMDFKTREYKSIKKKRDNLADVIKYEAIAQNNDSILSIVAMTDEKQVAYYEDYITRLKAQEEATRKRIAEAAQKEANKKANAAGGFTSADKSGATAGPPSALGATSMASTGMTNMPARRNTDNSGMAAGAASGATGPFYFYTPATVSYGKLEFKGRWGGRPLADNWRVATEMRGKGAQTDGDDDETSKDSLSGKNNKADKPVDPRYTANYYIKQLPTGQKVLDSLAKDRNFAYYQLGIIYKEKFKEYERAAARLERLLQNEPEERLILPAKYNLFKIYEIIDPARAQVYKREILDKYPDSRYAEIIKNPASDTVAQGSPDAVYAALYKKYRDGQVREVSAVIEEYIDTYNGEEILPKFELLKAKISGRLQGVDEYKKVLNYVALTYPNSSEGKEADGILKKDVPALEKLAFGQKPTTFKIIFKMDAADAKTPELTEKIQKFIKDGNNNHITLSTDIYTLTENFIVIHGLINKLAAVDAVSILKDFKGYKVAETPYIISTEDYKVVQVKKNFVQFLAIE